MNKQITVYGPPKRNQLNNYNSIKLVKKQKNKKNNNNSKMQIITIPKARSYIKKSSSARVKSSKDGVTVSHCEFISQIKSPITGNTNEDLNVFKIVFAGHVNPGNKNLFPWLSLMSYNYESYKFKSLKFIYKPICNTDTTGTISIAMDYDPDDALYNDKVQLMSAKSATSGQPWTLIKQSPNAKDFNKEKTYYISHRDYGTISSNSLKLLDCGTIQVGIDSAKGNQLLGELYVDYEVELLTPELNVNEILNNYSKSSSQNLNIAANNDSLLGTVVENKPLLKKLAIQGYKLLKVVGGLKGDVIRAGTSVAKHAIVSMLSNGANRPVITHKVIHAPFGDILEVNSESQILGTTELDEEIVAGDMTNFTDVTSTNVSIMTNHHVLTTAIQSTVAVAIPKDGYLQISGAGYGVDHSIFNIIDISESAFNEIKALFG